MKSFIPIILLAMIANNMVALENKGEFNSKQIITNYYPEQMRQHPQNWDVASDSNGIMYFANSGGLLEYDGQKWNIIPIPGVGCYSLLNYNNRIFVGGKEEIGYISQDSLCRNIFMPLKDSVLNSTNTGRVNDLINFDDKIFILTSSNLIVKSNTETKIYYPEKRFGRSFIFNNHFYIRDYGSGLKILKGNKLIPVENTGILKTYHLMFALPLDNEMLLGTYNSGLYIFNGKEIKKYASAANGLLYDSQVDHAVKLFDGNTAIATRQKGLIIITEKGKVSAVYDKSNGLQDNNVKKIFADKNNNIWLALNSGISKLEYSSPFNFINADETLEGIILSLIKYKKKLYIGTTSGLYMYFENKISRIDGFNAAVWQLELYNDRILAASGESLSLFDGFQREIILNSHTTKFLISKRDPNIIYTFTRDGLQVLKKSNNNWTSSSYDLNLADRILSFYEDVDDLWISTSSKGAVLIKDFKTIIGRKTYHPIPEKNITIYYTSNSPLEGQIQIYEADNNPLFATQKGIYKYDRKTGSFIPDTIFGTQFADGSRGVFNITKVNNHTFALHSNVENYLAFKQSPGEYKIVSTPFKRMEKEQVNVIYPDGEHIWFGTNKTVFSYRLNDNKNYNTTFNTLVRKVFINTDSLIYGGASILNIINSGEIKFENRNLRFQYAATFYEAEDRTEYQYKLDGYDENWSNWTMETQKDYTNLSEGKYTFNVRGRNVYGSIGKIGSYKFSVLPPFYRTIWAYIIYIILAVSFGYVIVKWRINKLQKDKLNLEKLVDEKTREVKQQAEKLQELDKIKSRFFANISHEFRTPLTLILGPIEQLLIEDKSEKRSKTYSLIQRNSKRLLMLINQLLDLSKLESGRMNLNLSKINIVKLVQEVSSLFESVAVKKNIDLVFNSAEKSIQIYCDLDKMEKVLINLFSNAFKFTTEGKVMSSVELNGDTVAIKIKDTGIGIDDDKLEKVFEHFYQADNSTKRSFEGSGIGLSLVKEFIELHKGSIVARSNANMGTEFEIQLPVNVNELLNENSINDFAVDESEIDFISSELIADNNEESLPAGLPENKSNSGDKDTILIVEDNSDVREYLKDHLSGEFEIAESVNGKEGIESALKLIPDLIISDVMMPVMDGYEFCKQVKTNLLTSHIPVILLTAKAGDKSILEGLDYGANDYITKPFNVNILNSRINNLIALRKNLQDKIKSDLLLKPSEIKVSSYDEDFLNNLHNLIEENIDDPELSIEELADKLFMNRISLYRKIKALTGDSPSVFLRSYRLKRAVQLLEGKKGNVTEIAFMVGFTNSAYFTKCFREQFNRLPSEYLSN